MGWKVPAVFLLAFVPFRVAVLADDDEPGRGEKLFEAALLRVADSSPSRIGAFYSPNARDRLSWGSVEVRRKHEVEIRLEGAEPSAKYGVQFCWLGSACQTIGDVETDRNGDARERLPFSLPGTDFSGVFVLVRGVPQFVSGWRFPTEAAPAVTTEVSLRGEISFIGANFLRLRGLTLDIVVTQETRFERVSGLSALKVGDEVIVEGYVRGDGAIVATVIRLDDKPSPPHGPKAR